jgi:hypothetical protein
MERQAPWTVQLPLVVVFLGGIASIALGVRTKGDDVGYRGLVQMLLGALVLALATSVKNGNRDSRSILLIVLAGGSAMTALLHTISVEQRLGGLAAVAFVIALLTFPRPSRMWFGDLDVAEVADESLFDE